MEEKIKCKERGMAINQFIFSSTDGRAQKFSES